MNALIESRLALGTAGLLSRALPPSAGNRLAAWLGSAASSMRRSGIVTALEANHWVALDKPTDRAEVLESARSALQLAVRGHYQLLRSESSGQPLASLLEPTEAMSRLLDDARRGQEGFILLGAHTGNFDLVLHALAHEGFRAQVLSVPQPNASYRTQNESRRAAGLEMTPLSKDALLGAEARLQASGVVVTGIDRPTANPRRMPRFFGLPSALPVVHVRLAQRAQAPIWLADVTAREDGTQRVDALGPFLFEGDEDTTAGAERLLAVLEPLIRAKPEQWLMFHRVWPDALPAWQRRERA